MRKRLTILVIPLAVALAVVGAGVGESAEPANERAARQDAERRLESFSPPPESTRVGSTGTRLDGPGETPFGDTQYLAVDGYWISSEPLGATMEWLRGAAPAGSRLTVIGGSGRGVRASHEPGASYDFGYWWPDLRWIASERELEVTVTRRGTGTAISASARAEWVEPRPESEKIPVGVRTIEIERELLRGEYLPHGTGIVERQLIGDRRRVASVVAGIDGLEVVQATGTHSCPLEAPRYELRVKFLREPGDDPLAVASMNSPFGPCSVFSLEIEGEEQRPLAEEWIFHRRIGGALRRLDDRAG